MGTAAAGLSPAAQSFAANDARVGDRGMGRSGAGRKAFDDASKSDGRWRSLLRSTLRRFERGLADRDQRVVGATQDAAGDGQAGCLVADPLAQLQVVGVVGGACTAGGQSGLVGGPAQHRWPLTADPTRLTLAIRLVHGDVEAGEADHLARRGEAARITDRGVDCDRGQVTDAVEATERARRRMRPSEATQLIVERRQSGVEEVDGGQRRLGDGAAGGRELGALGACAFFCVSVGG